MADIGLGNFIREYMIPIIMIIAAFATSLYAIYLSIRINRKRRRRRGTPEGVR